tara:strand:- start:408 stop:755 length:348 start_codon:yes stop_codon:yes gene_type:complete
MIPLLNFIAVILLIFVTSYLFIEMYNIKMYLETNENQLNNLVDDINHNNEVLEGKLKSREKVDEKNDTDNAVDEATLKIADTIDAGAQAIASVVDSTTEILNAIDAATTTGATTQ